MKTHRDGSLSNPKLYQNFKSSKDIADTINRSRSYVFKAIRDGFTDREKALLEEKARTEIF